MKRQPLAGKRVVITRAHHQAAPLARELEALGATVISLPTIEIRPPQSFQPLDKALAKIQKYDFLLLTSVNGVEALERRLDKAGIPLAALRHLTLVAIGPATRDAIVALGLKVDLMPERYVAEGVVEALAAQVKGKSLLLVRAKVARDVIPRALREAGAEVDVVEAYQTVLPVNAQKRLAQHLLEGRLQADVITFTSSSTVSNFIALLPSGVGPQRALSGVVVASIGPVTSETLRRAGVAVDVESESYTVLGLIGALGDHFQEASRTEQPSH